MKKIISLILGVILLNSFAPSVYASLLSPVGNQGGGLLNPGLIHLDGLYITPNDPLWDFEAPSLSPGCLEVDAQGHFASTGSNCSSGNASTSPGGLTSQIQFNGFGSFVGDSNLTWSTSTQKLLATNIVTTNSTSTNGTTTNFFSTNASFTTILAGLWNGTKIGLAYGGTNADLSSTGGTSQVLKQSSLGSAITVGTLASSNLSDSNNVALLNGSQSFSGTVTFANLIASTVTVGGSSIVPISTTTAALGGGLLTAGTCASVTATTTSTITTSMAVVATPVTYPGDGTNWDAYIGPSNTVVVKVCALVTVTPTSTQYNIRVIP